MPTKPTDRQEGLAEFVSEFGLHMESSGLPRLYGRILGRLLVCEPPHQSSAELADALHASRGAISTATRALHTASLIQRLHIPGKRSTYFQIPPGVWTQHFHRSIAEMRPLIELAERALAHLDDRPAAARMRLDELHDLYLFMEREMPALVKRWEATREKT